MLLNTITISSYIITFAFGFLKHQHKMASVCENVSRPLAGFPQDIWGDRFLEAHADPAKLEAYANEIDPLKDEVRAMLLDGFVENQHKCKLELMDVVTRLGISYYFEKEIQREMEHIFETYNYESDYDLYTVGVHFRVFRQHGYKMCCDVFNKFKDGHGKLQEGLKRDIKGVLSLYEATHLRMHNEDFMDEAFDETTNLLKLVTLESCLGNQSLYKQVLHATKQALHFGVKRVENRLFISFYEEQESHDKTLLRLAKLNFNMLQLIHRQELSHIVGWWKSMDVKTQLPYARDRSLECHFWATALYFEQQYSQGRIFMTKVFTVISILDDTYDAYGTIQELRLLTQAFERWDKDLVDELPGKMKLVFMYVYNVYEEFDKEMEKQGRGYAAHYAKQRVLAIIRSYYQEAIWCNQRYVPSYDEYMTHARITAVSQIVTTSSMLGMEPEIANKNAFEWVTNPVPKVIRGSEVIGRLIDDIVTHEEERKRAFHVASAVECYMNEHGVSRDEAVGVLRKYVRDAWKDMNEDIVKPVQVPPRVLEISFNIGRLVDSLYKDMDGYTYSAKVMKNEALLVYDQAFDI